MNTFLSFLVDSIFDPAKGLLLDFVFYYPLFMAYLWMTGAIFHYFHFERRYIKLKVPPELKEYPGVALVVPCHNEEQHAQETITQLLLQDYPDFEVIAINDGSKDRTGAILDELAKHDKRLRVIHQTTNQGKAVGLNMAALMTDKEFLVCVDADTLLDENAVAWMMQHFVNSPRVGAVTGNPRIRNRSTLLGRVQVGEFSSILGLIKRAQRIFGRIYTVSGVVSAFRTSAIHEVGYWSPEMLTDDIDASWKLQLAHWDIRFEPKALCWILMPETFAGLWKQRLRWSMGGIQALLKFLPMLFSWKSRRMWMIYAEFLLSISWGYAISVATIFALLSMLFPMPDLLYVPPPTLGWTGVVLGVTCMLQITISLLLDYKYDYSLWRVQFWMVWYPLIYWMLTVLTVVVAVPRILLRNNKPNATWESPDRGVR